MQHFRSVSKLFQSLIGQQKKSRKKKTITINGKKKYKKEKKEKVGKIR